VTVATSSIRRAPAGGLRLRIRRDPDRPLLLCGQLADIVGELAEDAVDVTALTLLYGLRSGTE
ncbi:hypothetical protein, partial [Streptomyces rubellomurinus]|uniref:hypothetical protein n=1 Tax=Streptomyces rubellomurinus (strain ATCC 31215) TaxID=359131 RepID=UPI0012FF1D1C